MKRLALLIAPLVLVVALVAAGGESSSAPRYTVELDNAFGLTVGSDFKVAGVRAGTIKDLRIDEQTNDALVDIEVTTQGFGDLRTDAFCESRPQSLIGEYYLDCVPGSDPKKLSDGARVPLEQTGSTVPVDLLNNVMRLPYRERLRIILAQLGVGLAARGEDLNEAIRRASPALRETNRVLAILAEQNITLRDLVTDADTVLTALSGNREDVTRWVSEARATAADSAERRVEIAAGLNRLPGFLRELRPAMADLGRAVDAQSPALADLDAASRQLETLFNNLEPFAQASQVNLRSLGETSEIGRDAVQSAQPVIAQLDRFSVDTPELANNLRIVLEHLDDRDRAVEEDPRSPGGEGYTGLEALLQFTFDQPQAINIFDGNGYTLKANLFESECSEYQNEDTIRGHIEDGDGLVERCASWLGPNQQGVIQPDITDQGQGEGDSAPVRRRGGSGGDGGLAPAPSGPPAPVATPGLPATPPAPAGTPTAQEPLVPLVDETLEVVPEVQANPQDLLDFLLG